MCSRCIKHENISLSLKLQRTLANGALKKHSYGDFIFERAKMRYRENIKMQ